MNQLRSKRKPQKGRSCYSKQITNKYESAESEVVTVGGKSYQKAVQARDRYRELAREALVSGDRVGAENYFQHADHYNRIICAALETGEQDKSTERKPNGNGGGLRRKGERRFDETSHKKELGLHGDASSEENIGNLVAEKVAEDKYLGGGEEKTLS